MVAQPIRTIKIFYCYAPEDDALREELARQLSPFRRLRYITGWYNRDIRAGADWEKESRTHLDAANIILLLLSADFFVSDYHYAIEMEQAIRKHRAGTAYVIPILLRPVSWKETPLGELSVLPRNERPVTRWKNRDEAWLQVVQGIREVIKDLLQKQPLSSEENDVLYPEQGPLSGHIVGKKYLLGELLGESIFSQVYKAQHIEAQRQQVVKVLLERHFRKPEFRERFLREARIVASLDHRNIIHLDDFGIEASQAYLVMPYISGGTLQGILEKQQGFLELDQIVSYLEDICDALDYAHKKIVHLDLKPLNLLVHEDGRLLLSDFGLAHLMKQGAIEGGSSLRAGTPHYMAPEHINGLPEKGSDLFSLGVILYQMLVGRLPFDGLLQETILLKNLTERPPALRALRPELPKSVEDMLGKALAKQPEQRYQTAKEFLEAFKKALTTPAKSPIVSIDLDPVVPPDFAGAAVRLYVLGQFRLEYRNEQQQWQPVTDTSLQHQRVRALLHCLVSSPGRKLGREQAIEMLWPDLDFETATNRLDKAVYNLRRLFEPGRSRPATSNLLLTEHATLILADQAQLWVDADAFEALLSQARTSSDPGQTEQLLEEAMLLYGGHYLPEERDIPWIQARRESLQRNWIGLLLELADLRITREALSSAIDTLDRLLAVDPANEAAVQRLVILLAQSGRRAEALRIYQRFAAVLRQEYKIAPLPETRALYEAARRGEDPAAHAQAGVSQGVSLLDSQAAEAQLAETHAYVQVGRSNQSPLVGREQELQILHRILLATEQAKRMKLAGQKKAASLTFDTQRRPQCVILIGDVGIGKTRLAEETGREAKRRGWAVAWTRAYAQESSIPYRMWVESLRKAMTQGLWQRQEIARRPLIYQSLGALLPELQDLLPQEALPKASPPEQEQLRLWEATRALLAIISENTPLFIVLDDLQWADSSSCELLAYLVRQLRDQPVMFLCTCRDTELPNNHPLRGLLTDLQREQAVEQIPVRPLSDTEISQLIGHLPEPVVKSVSSRASGNPFFAEELARGITTNTVDVTLDPANPNQLPDTIQAVLDRRLARITEKCQRILECGAVLGRSFELDPILDMASGDARADEDEILELLEEALQAGLLTEEGSGMDIIYHFWHPLLLTYLYERLSAARRTSLHRKAAQVLQTLYAGNEAEGAAEITDHLVKGGATSTW